MSPFLQLRLWWRRGSAAQRLSSSAAVALVVALAAWALVPAGEDEPETTTAVDAGGAAVGPAGTPVGGQPGETATGDPAVGGAQAPVGDGGPAPTAQAGAAPTGAAGQPAAAAGQPAAAGASQPAAPRCSPASGPGVDGDKLLIGVGLLNLAGPIGNSAAGQASAEDQRRLAEAVVADINTRGVQCKKLAAKYYEGNPINPEQQRATCLQMIQDRLLLVADAGAFAFPPGAYNCPAQQKVPVLTVSPVLGSEINRFAPYLASVGTDAGSSMRDVAFGARDRGLFDPARGFKKLGLLFDDCSPEWNRALEESLAKAGISSGQTSKYVFPCPSGGFAPANQLTQAVAQHRQDGVTHVIPLTGGGSFKPYTEIAETQRFRPKYILSDLQGIIITSASSLKPNPENFDRSVAITTTQLGSESTPGFQPGATTKRCQAVAQKAGLPADIVFKGGGGVCAVLWTAEAAIKNARAVTREGVLPGLFNAGPVAMPFPLSDVSYRAPSKLHGGDSWWPLEWQKECTCWRVTDRNRRPTYAP